MEWTTVIDIMPLQAAPKIMRPISRQLPSESHRLLESVTSKLLSKEYGEATHAKHCRSSSSASGTRRPTGSDAASSGSPSFCFPFLSFDSMFVPRYFDKDIQSGVPTLTQAGAREGGVRSGDQVRA
ncbi:hypothetical protein EDB85DRAFT_246075 [Lactarius pseudohatsudake]|nr:hypothetical protein EDB85DRAFT_246075 [Lactarius pseudohatsudake]